MPESSGTLTIRTYTAGGALPVPGAVVRIKGAGEDNRLISYTLITDRDGITEPVRIPAPSASYSMAPGAAELPYSVYDIEVSAPGYFSKRINGLTVFSGVDSIQLVNMIPSSGNNIEDFPRGNVNAVIPENESLQ